MNIDKIAVDGHYVWVDEVVGWSYNGLCYNDDGTIGKPNNLNSKKIIAASSELELKGIPTYVDYLANNYCNSFEFNDCCGTTADVDFAEGYKAAEKDLFTENDVRRAIELAQEWDIHNNCFKWKSEDVIEQLKQSKTLKTK